MKKVLDDAEVPNDESLDEIYAAVKCLDKDGYNELMHLR